MANLVDQINEMIDILEVVNPAAARAFRSAPATAQPAAAPAQAAPAPVAQPQLQIPQPHLQVPVPQLQVPQPHLQIPQPLVQVPRPEVQAAASPQEPAVRRIGIGENQELPVQSVGPHILPLNLTADRLVEGIILSEVLGPPVSRRRSLGRR